MKLDKLIAKRRPKRAPSQFSHLPIGGLPVWETSKPILKVRIEHKPVSVNESHYLRRGKPKTRKYIDFQESAALVLCDHPIKLKDGDSVRVDYVFGYSRKSSDVDNCIKTTQDTLQTYYDFNDSIIYHVRASKVIVPKGEEYVDITMRKLK